MITLALCLLLIGVCALVAMIFERKPFDRRIDRPTIRSQRYEPDPWVRWWV